MNKNEVIIMMATLREAYPNYYKDKTKEELTVAVNLWHRHFKDDDSKLVNAAIDAFVATDTKGFPPLIGQIKAQLHKITQPEQMTEQEAWNLISKAVKNSAYHATEEHKKLPIIIQKLVTSEQLREWSQMPVESVQSVVASNFMRSYKIRAASEQEYQKLPNDIKNLIGKASEALRIGV